jgi:hypothetical protein
VPLRIVVACSDAMKSCVTDDLQSCVTGDLQSCVTDDLQSCVTDDLQSCVTADSEIRVVLVCNLEDRGRSFLATLIHT